MPQGMSQMNIQQGMQQMNMQQGMPQMNMVAPQMNIQQGMPQPFVNMQPAFGNGLEQQMMQPQNQVVYPSQIAMPQNGMPQNNMPSQTGGDSLNFPYTIQSGGIFPRISAGGDGVIANPLPGGNAMLVVDTGGSAMAQMGLDQGGGRRIRRYQGAAPSMGGMDQGPAFPSAMPSFSSGGSIRITKLE